MKASLNGGHQLVLDRTDSTAEADPLLWDAADTLLLHMRCHALMQLGSLDQAGATGDALLEHLGRTPGGDDQLRAQVQNHRAYILALQGVDLDRAEHLIRAALDVAEDAARKGTLGAILVQTEAQADGVALLNEVLDDELQPVDEFETRLFLALGLDRLGRKDEAIEHRKRAAMLSMEHDLVAPPIFVGIVASRDQPGE